VKRIEIWDENHILWLEYRKKDFSKYFMSTSRHHGYDRLIGFPFLRRNYCSLSREDAEATSFARQVAKWQKGRQKNAGESETDNTEDAGGIQRALPCQEAECQQKDDQKNGEQKRGIEG
jgi:hypothetical protein